MTVSNKEGSEKAKIKVATYNYYFALTYNNLRTRQQQYSQYGLDPKQYNLDVDFDKKLSKQTTKMMITKLLLGKSIFTMK